MSGAFAKPAEKAAQLLSLEGRVAMVSGAASGIGREIVTLLAQMGAAVIVLDINEQAGSQTALETSDAGAQARFFRCDVSSAQDCTAAAAMCIEAFGKIDILCNNAGIAVRKSVPELQEHEWDLTQDVILKGTFLLSRAVIPHMIRNGGGSIVNIGSGWSLKGGPEAAAYCAAKAGVLNLTRAMAIDHGKDNIRVNCVCPGDVDTALLRSECAQLGGDAAKFMQEAADRPLRRIGTTADVAHAVLFLASHMADWITGASLVVDGGGLA